MKIKQSRYIVISDSLDNKNDLKSEKIIFSTRTGKGIKISNYVIDLINQGSFTLIPDRLFTILMYHEIIVPEEENELELIVSRKLLTAIDILKQQISLLIKGDVKNDSDLFSKELKKVTSFIVDKNLFISHINVCLSIDSFSRDFINFEHCKQFIDSDEALQKCNIYYELLITNLQISNLVEFLPISNPKFNKIIFNFKSSSSKNIAFDLGLYLTNLLSIIKKSNYLNNFPIDCYFYFDKFLNKIKTNFIEEFKKLSLSENINLFFYFPRGNSKMENETLESLELEFLTILSQNKIRATFFPYPEITYFDKQTETKKFTNFLINISENRSPVSLLSPEDILFFSTSLNQSHKKIFYDFDFAKNITDGVSQCSNCVYLPMCGGRLEKKSNTDADCPVFIRNFMTKVKFMYNFPI
jgi:hypothetical protein